MGHQRAKPKRRKKKRHEHEPAQLGATASDAAPSEHTALAPVHSSQPPGAAASQAATDDVELDLTDVVSLIPEPPRVPAPRMRSGFAPRLPERDRSDRAEIEVEDLSLRPDNPYVASPLLSVPPEEPTVSPTARAAKLVGIGFLVASSSYGVWAAMRDLHSSMRPQATGAEISDVRGSLRTSAGATLEPSKGAADRRPRAPATAVASAPEAAAPGAELARGQALPAQPAVEELAPPDAPSTTDRAAASVSAPAPQTAPGPLPKRPSSDALRASFAAIKPMLRACVPGRHGLVTIHATIHGHGRISQGSIVGLDHATAEEHMCMTRALLELRFPPFQQDSFTAAFPLAL
jgi:hypothetical protein